MKKEFIFDLLEDELIPIDDSGIIVDTGADYNNIRKIYRKKMHTSGKKVRPVRRRFMFGLAAALISAAAIVGTMAVVAQTNGEIVEPKDVPASETAKYTVPTAKVKELREEIKKETNENAEELFYKKNGFYNRDVTEENWSLEIYNDFRKQELYYKNKLYREMLKKIVDDGYGDQSIIPEKPKYDYWVKGDNEWYWLDEIDLYCDEITAFCNAYNDMNYQLTDKERVFISDTLETSYDNLFDYVQMQKKIYRSYFRNLRINRKNNSA